MLVNSFVTERTNHRGACLIGVRKEGNKFRSYIHEQGKQINLGSYFCEIEAHEKWKLYKHNKAKELIDIYPTMDSRVKNSLELRYVCTGIYEVI